MPLLSQPSLRVVRLSRTDAIRLIVLNLRHIEDLAHDINKTEKASTENNSTDSIKRTENSSP